MSVYGEAKGQTYNHQSRFLKSFSIFSHMKKLILILSILALNVFAETCRDYIRYLFNGDMSDNFRMDSIYAVSFIDDKDTSYYTAKYFYTDNKLDSTISCGSYGCKTVKYKQTIDKTDSTIKLTHLDLTYDNREEHVILLDKDSSTTYVYGLDSGKPDSLEIISYRSLHNDTLHYNNWFAEGRPYTFGNQIYAPDPNDENICNYTIYNSEYESENGTYQLIITNTENGFQLFHTQYNQSAFFIYTNNSTTSFQHKIRPTIIPEKAKHFDLLGRPANSKYIIKVNR